MRMHGFTLAPALLAVFTVAAEGADVSGEWKADFKTNYGTDLEGNPLPRERGETTFVFQQKGEELTGSVRSTAFSETRLLDGKVSGENVSFVLIRNFGRRERKMTYNGTVRGDEIRFQTTIEGFGQGVKMVAKKVR